MLMFSTAVAKISLSNTQFTPAPAITLCCKSTPKPNPVSSLSANNPLLMSPKSKTNSPPPNPYSNQANSHHDANQKAPQNQDKPSLHQHSNPLKPHHQANARTSQHD